MNIHLRSPVGRFNASWLALAVVGALGAVEAHGQVISPGFSGQFSMSEVSNNAGQVTQMAFGPDGRLYASRASGGAVSWAYNATTGALTDKQQASDVSGLGIGFDPARGEMYLSSYDAIWRLTRTGSSPQWGSAAGDTKVAIATNIPTGDHTVDQIQIVNNTLYVGIGDRTINGKTGAYTGLVTDDYGGKGFVFGGTGTTFGESAYNGSISWIQDLSKVASTTNSAGVIGAFSQATIQTDASPLSSAVDKLVVHSEGTRNPYGLALDKNGNLFFTNNYNRATTNGDGTSNPSPLDAAPTSFAHSVHDQFFKASSGADYGFTNDNWRGLTNPAVKSPLLDPSSPGYHRVNSITPDNLYSTDTNYLKPYDPSHPVGLGPNASADGVAFWYDSALPSGLNGNAFIARWTNSVTETAPGTTTLKYADLVAVDPSTGGVVQIAEGFGDPLAVLADSNNHLLVSDYTTGQIFEISVVPEPSPLLLAAVGASLAACWAWCRKSARGISGRVTGAS